MLQPLPCTLILTDQQVDTSGCVLHWTAGAMPKPWKGTVPSSGSLVLNNTMARMVSEHLFGLIWEAHKPQPVGTLHRGLDLRTAPSGER